MIPTLNSERTLTPCLEAICNQDYPFDRIQIVIADGGSHDHTREIASRYGALIVDNALVTGEAGKAAALRAATGELIALVDSDNILVGSEWLRRMTQPFEDPAVVGAEPLRFVALPSDTIIDRYCALSGANDPLCLFVGNYDKYSCITGSWTSLDIAVVERDGYFVFGLDGAPLPTIGANGTIYRKAAVEGLIDQYLMDVDVPILIGARDPSAKFAKVDVGIRHLFCRDVGSFVRKQRRRVRDFLSSKREATERVYPWRSVALVGIVKFLAASITIVPLVYQSFRAYARCRDRAAFFHPVACWLTLWVYAWNVVFMRGRSLSREGWRQ